MKNVGIIEKLGCENIVFTLKSKGKTFEEISQYLTEKYGEAITFEMVRGFFERNKRTTILRRNDLIIKQKEQAINVVEQMQTLNDEMWDFFRDLKEQAIKNPNLSGTVVKAAAHLLEQLKLNAKMTGQLREEVKSQTLNISYVTLAPKINEYILKLKKMGTFYCGQCKSRDIRIDEKLLDEVLL